MSHIYRLEKNKAKKYIKRGFSIINYASVSFCKSLSCSYVSQHTLIRKLIVAKLKS